MSVPRSATITLAVALLIGTPVALALVTFLAITSPGLEMSKRN
jgi:hypothetical protein